MSVYNNLFGPLNSDYCMIFYVLMLITFFYLIISVLMILGYLLASKKKEGKVVGLLTTNALIMLIAYFTHRTLYSMCISSLS